MNTCIKIHFYHVVWLCVVINPENPAWTDILLMLRPAYVPSYLPASFAFVKLRQPVVATP